MNNKGDIERAKGKLKQFIYSMASGPGNIKSRLIDSEEYLFGLWSGDFPMRYREDWKNIWNDLTKKGRTRSLSSIGNTTLMMRYATVSKIIKKIINLSSRLEESHP